MRECKRLKREAKREVAKANEIAVWKEWYANLNSIEGDNQIYRIAKSREKQQKDITKMAGIINKLDMDSIVTEEDKIRERWQEYFTELLNIENGREQLPKVNKVKRPVQEISKEEVYAIKQMKSGKAAGPSGISAEHLKYLNDEGVEWVKELLNRIIKEEKIPTEWTKSYIVTIYKGKGDQCSARTIEGLNCWSMD